MKLPTTTLHNFLLWTLFASFLLSSVALQPVALLTGATGRTGKIVTDLLLERGYEVVLFCRDGAKAQQTFNHDGEDKSKDDRVNVLRGDISCREDIRKAFFRPNEKSTPTHVVFMAGGEGADYRAVNHKGVAAFAELAAQCESVRNFVVISSAWDTKPYSIASLLFNSIYKDTDPMASHYLGEQILRKASKESSGRLNYVILRAGGLNSDENYAKKYPDAVAKGLTYQQGDNFDFFGFAGRPGMSRSQLANAVVSAMDVGGRYTVEVTGSGMIGLEESSVYQNLVQDDMTLVPISNDQEEEIVGIHTQAVERLKQTAIFASLGGLAFIGVFGFFQGLILLLSMDAVIILIWSQFFANRQAL